MQDDVQLVRYFLTQDELENRISLQIFTPWMYGGDWREGR